MGTSWIPGIVLPMHSSRPLAVGAILAAVAFVLAASFLLTRAPDPELDPAPVVVSVVPTATQPTATQPTATQPAPQPPTELPPPPPPAPAPAPAPAPQAPAPAPQAPVIPYDDDWDDDGDDGGDDDDD
jgi:hypothetical protein